MTAVRWGIVDNVCTKCDDCGKHIEVGDTAYWTMKNEKAGIPKTIVICEPCAEKRGIKK